MNSARSSTNIVVLDACRNNPFARSFRSVSRGLARVDAPKGTLIAYATAPGDVARDGDSSNSPYTQSLAQAIETSYSAPIESVFKTTRRNVLKMTDNKQVPWESSSVVDDFFFHAGGPNKSVENQTEKPVELVVIPDPPSVPPSLKPAAPTPKTEPPAAPDVRPASLPLPNLGRLARCGTSTLAGAPAELCVSSRLPAASGNMYELDHLSDGRMSTAWVEGAPGDGIGETILMTFSRPTTARKLRLVNGYAKNADIFRKNNRVRTLQLTTSAGEIRTLHLSDNTSWQEFALSSAREIKWLMLKIISVYPGWKYQDTAISELRVE
ncbi:NADase-type glycan-binding domain-containing protein [Rhizobium bangladeshense]|uniref:NADase-type glycan-binding domain-containing protein n=1 Tax=Rhizobium bangladeshense TaxID=1138189 RepID=UPI001C82EE2D|nr:caspase family protein [Rhizobium bangladeshense]MBX4912786.1 hypothetical protein [Rhizobium bangladeshense]